jgi:hypothetical protein
VLHAARAALHGVVAPPQQREVQCRCADADDSDHGTRTRLERLVRRLVALDALVRAQVVGGVVFGVHDCATVERCEDLGGEPGIHGVGDDESGRHERVGLAREARRLGQHHALGHGSQHCEPHEAERRRQQRAVEAPAGHEAIHWHKAERVEVEERDAAEEVLEERRPLDRVHRARERHELTEVDEDLRLRRELLAHALQVALHPA